MLLSFNNPLRIDAHEKKSLMLEKVSICGRQIWSRIENKKNPLRFRTSLQMLHTYNNREGNCQR
jgi:hypothetical protein